MQDDKFVDVTRHVDVQPFFDDEGGKRFYLCHRGARLALLTHTGFDVVPEYLGKVSISFKAGEIAVKLKMA